MCICQIVGHLGCLFPYPVANSVSIVFKGLIALWMFDENIPTNSSNDKRNIPNHLPPTYELSTKPIAKMKEAVVNKEVKVEIKDVAVPKPGPNEVLIKVVVAGLLSPLLFARQASMMSSRTRFSLTRLPRNQPQGLENAKLVADKQEH